MSKLRKKKMELYVDGQQEELLRLVSEQTGKSMSALFRDVIDTYLKDYVEHSAKEKDYLKNQITTVCALQQLRNIQ